MKKVVVIGAGISGLSAAIYAQRSGFDVTLCEQHSIAGGTCTAWKRKGYLFEGAMHWLTGSSPKTEIHRLWRETGALNDGVKVFLHDPFQAVKWEGRTICLYRDIEKTVEHLIALSPNDEKRLRRMVRDVKTFTHLQMPVIDVKGIKTQSPRRMTFGDILKMIFAIPVFIRLSKMSISNYTEKFEHPAIQQLFRMMPGLSDKYSAVFMIATLATFDIGDGGYPEGGSLAMVERMTKTFKDSGGKLLLNTKVERVNIENGAVTGVTLKNNALDADAVIVTQETIAAVNNLFNTPLKEAWLQDVCQNAKSAVCTFVCVGIRAEISSIPLRVWNLETPITYAGTTVSELNFYNYAGFEGYAPKGCSILTTALMCDTYDFWKKAKEEGSYEEEKQRLAQQISRIICQEYPLAEGNIEVIDVATPLTYERYTGAYHGSWMTITGVGDKMKTYSGFLKSVKGLYFAGHRLMAPGGLPVALFTGRQAAQMVCRQFEKDRKMVRW
jgi:phytoene dehydrogenase-like protein